MSLHSRMSREGDLSSTLAFSLLFVFPAVSAVWVWMVLRTLDRTVGLGVIPLFPWVLLFVPPALTSAGIAQWACRRSGTEPATAWGFSIAAAMIAALFTVVSASWFLDGGY